MTKLTVDGEKRAGRQSARTKTVRVTHLRYEIWKATKLQATEEDRPLVDVISDALSEYLAKRGWIDVQPRKAQNGRAGREA